MEDKKKELNRVVDYGYKEEEEEEDKSIFDRFADYIKQRQELAKQRAKKVV